MMIAVELIVVGGADPAVADAAGLTPLALAADRLHAPLVDTLCKYGAPADGGSGGGGGNRHDLGCSPIMLALRRRSRFTNTGPAAGLSSRAALATVKTLLARGAHPWLAHVLTPEVEGGRLHAERTTRHSSDRHVGGEGGVLELAAHIGDPELLEVRGR